MPASSQKSQDVKSTTNNNHAMTHWYTHTWLYVFRWDPFVVQNFAEIVGNNRTSWKEKDIERNELVVGIQDELKQQILLVGNVNWLSIEPPVDPFRAQVKIRYKSAEEWAVINPEENGYAEVKFDRKITGITPGQAAVFYNKDICLGGGIIQTNER